MAEPTARTVERDTVALRVWEWPGHEPPALLLHGIGNYGRYWDAFAAAIGGRVRLIAPDARGHGDSGAPERGYESEEFVADALAILGALGVERAAYLDDTGHMSGVDPLLALDRAARAGELAAGDLV
ncbi:MAG: alpha/beta fold hydrolase, partial [Candidatus Limnocylindria bacterium]